MISKLTNSTIGSNHWFRTLTSIIKDNAVYCINHPNDFQRVKEYNNLTLEAINELLNNFESMKKLVKKALLEETRDKLELL